KVLKYIMSHPLAQWLYKGIHPNWGIGLAGWLSGLGPKHLEGNTQGFLGEEKEWLVQFAIQKRKELPIDYFIFGHRHIAVTHPLPQESLYLNLGDWISLNTFAEFDGQRIVLKTFKPKNHGT